MRRRPEDNFSSSSYMPSNSNSRGAYGGGMPQAGPGRQVGSCCIEKTNKNIAFLGLMSMGKVVEIWRVEHGKLQCFATGGESPSGLT